MSEENGSNGKKPWLINQNSYISMTIMGMIVAATLWIKDGQTAALTANTATAGELVHYKEVQAKNFEIITTKIDLLASSVGNGTKDRYTGHDHKIFAKRLQELNPSLKVPDEPDGGTSP